MPTITDVEEVQTIKERRLEREFAWIKKEFQNIHTIADIELDNIERYTRLHLDI